MATGYDQDVVAWAVEQARLIRTGQFDQLDLEHIADEIEDVGKSEKRELASRLAVLLAHLLEWQRQPTRRGTSWERTMREQRKQIRRALKNAPSLGPLLSDPDWGEGVWADAVTLAISETGLGGFPQACPWSFSDVLTDGWRPA